MEQALSWQLGDCVEHKYFGSGRVDQIVDSVHGIRYHIRFEKISAWCPECDLRPARGEANDQT